MFGGNFENRFGIWIGDGLEDGYVSPSEAYTGWDVTNVKPGPFKILDLEVWKFVI